MKKKILTISLALILLITGITIGVSASTWMNYTGDVESSQSDVEEIMDILGQVHTDKLTAEEALAELELLNPPGLVKQIKELKNEIAVLKTDNTALNDYIIHLEKELTRANEEVKEITESTGKAVIKAREYVE